MSTSFRLELIELSAGEVLTLVEREERGRGGVRRGEVNMAQT